MHLIHFDQQVHHTSEVHLKEELKLIQRPRIHNGHFIQIMG